MGVKVSGFDEFGKQLKNLQKKAENASGDVSFNELFNDKFMRENTNSKDIQEFFDMSPFEIDTQEQFENLDENLLNQYINETTKFSSWEEMKTAAGKLYLLKKLGF